MQQTSSILSSRTLYCLRKGHQRPEKGRVFVRHFCLTSLAWVEEFWRLCFLFSGQKECTEDSHELLWNFLSFFYRCNARPPGATGSWRKFGRIFFHTPATTLYPCWAEVLSLKKTGSLWKAWENVAAAPQSLNIFLSLLIFFSTICMSKTETGNSITEFEDSITEASKINCGKKTVKIDVSTEESVQYLGVSGRILCWFWVFLCTFMKV